jgi:hypothetical protein
MEVLKESIDISTLLGKQGVASSSTAVALIAVILIYVLYVCECNSRKDRGLTQMLETSNANTSPQDCSSTRSPRRTTLHRSSLPTWRSRRPQ